MTREICFKNSFLRSKGLKPKTLISPEVGKSSPERHLRVVVLPAPFGPMNPTSSPDSMVKEMSLTAGIFS